MRETASATSLPISTFHPPSHLATGCSAIRSISAASDGRDLLHASACCFAADQGSTESAGPGNGLMNAWLADWAPAHTGTSMTPNVSRQRATSAASTAVERTDQLSTRSLLRGENAR